MNKDTVSINARDPIVLLRNEARKKPHIAELVSNVHNMSASDISEAKVLPWIKTALFDMKRIENEKHQYANMMTYMADKIIDGKSPDPIGETRRWIGGEQYIKMDRSSIEIKTGQYVWFDQTGVWLDTLHSKTIDQNLYRNTESCGQMSRGDYLGLERQRRNGTIGAPPHTVVYGEPSSAPTSPASGMFTIYRV